MRLFMANCTKQRRVIYYRLDFDRDGNFTRSEKQKSLLQISVESGKQVGIAGDLHISQAQSIMDQLSRHGAIGIDDFKKGALPRQLISFVMSIDRQVPANVMMDVHKHNMEFLARSGKSRRASAALVANKAVEDIVESTVKEFEVDMEQVPPGEGEPEPEGPQLAEGYRAPSPEEVSSVAPPPDEGRGRKRGRR